MPKCFSDWLNMFICLCLLFNLLKTASYCAPIEDMESCHQEENDDLERRVLMLTQKDTFAMEHKALSQEKEIANNSVLLKLRPKLWTDGLI